VGFYDLDFKRLFVWPNRRDAPVASLDVLYIGGAGRSGSTLLSTMLGAAPDVLTPGELCHLWQRGLIDNELCSCGERFVDCTFWTDVGAEAFGGWNTIDPTELLALAGRVTRHRHILFLRAGSPRSSFRADVRSYHRVLGQLYFAIAKLSECRVIIDSSKSAPYACALASVPGVRVRIVHLIRDSRGVAYSFAKRILRPERADDGVDMPRMSSFWAGRQWLETNLVFETLRATGLDVTRIFYEDYARDPAAASHALLATYFGQEELERAKLDSDVLFSRGHSIGGNPMRFHRGAIRIGVDEEWRKRMTRADRHLVELSSWPLLASYGYLSRRRHLVIR
jgi:hypothetical protein